MESILIPVSFFALIGIGLWFDAMKVRRRLQVQLELAAKSLEKIGNVQELTTFLETEVGRQFMGILSGIGRPSGQGLLFTVQVGIVFMVLGIAFLVLSVLEMDNDFRIPAIVCFFLGLGLTLAATVARRLSKTWSQTESAPTITSLHPYRDESEA